ncbi:uncharacterized protein LOC143905691 [Temnothorax americanus]|uniref:uncharacterized protein LOC143905691 n=1 Tax=Temnothorax americanus TaxID=1964332 RepID=UPI004068293D
MPERYHGHDPRDRFKGSPTATINQIDGERILSLRTGPLIIAQCTEEKEEEEEEEEEEDALFFVAVKQRGSERAGAQERRRGREYRYKLLTCASTFALQRRRLIASIESLYGSNFQ